MHFAQLSVFLVILNSLIAHMIRCVVHILHCYCFVLFRFGLIEGKLSKGFNLYTINIPIKRQTKPDPCFIAKWEGSSFKPRLVVNAGTEPLSSMAVR